jgi:uncharacterized membrane protein YecN with MAPEG domain
MTPVIVPAYAALLTLAYVVLSLRVTRVRFAARVSLGTGGQGDLERRIRAHGNFAEYVPLALLLLAFVETQGQSPALIHALCLLLITARAAHAYGLSTGTLRLRIAGVIATFVVLGVAALVLLRHAVI